MTDPKHEPATPTPIEQECDDAPKLTADEWAYVQAVTEDGDS